MGTKIPSAKTNASLKSSPNERKARVAAVHTALTEYFLGSAVVAEKFWNTNNPSLGGKSPANLAKTGKLNVVEQYVTYLRKHVRSVKPEIDNKAAEDVGFYVHEGPHEEIVEKLKEIPVEHGVVAITFENAESYYKYAPIFREILNRLPETERRQRRREQLVCARLLFSFTADLPIPVPNSQTLSQLVQREASRKLAALGGTMPDFPEIPRRRVPGK